MDKDGKKVALDSSETAKAVEYVKRLYKEACIEDCIGWLDPANNKAFLTSQISCTNNAYSIMVSAKRDLPEMGKVIEHGLNPKGPTGQRYHALVPVTHGVFAYSKDPQAAKDFLRWMMDPKQYRPWIASGDMYFAPYLHGFDKVPEWDIEPRVKPFQKVLETGKLTSWPAPANRQHGEVINRWIVIDMFTKAITGTPTKTAIAEAVSQIKAIYG
jgi:multiple sugar transport system substrate-binding protein